MAHWFGNVLGKYNKSVNKGASVNVNYLGFFKKPFREPTPKWISWENRLCPFSTGGYLKPTPSMFLRIHNWLLIMEITNPKGNYCQKVNA